MENLAPDIMRKRLMIEGYYDIDVDESIIKKFFTEICTSLTLRMYGEPIVFSPSGMGAQGNQGYDAFVPLIDSGISLYVWSSKRFLSCVIYTCKTFDDEKALDFTKSFFKISKVASMQF